MKSSGCQHQGRLVTGTSATVSGLAAATSCSFTVTAYNSAGESAASGAVQATTASSGGGVAAAARAVTRSRRRRPPPGPVNPRPAASPSERPTCTGALRGYLPRREEFLRRV